MKPKILIVCFYVPGTGFTRVVRSAMGPLSSNFAVHIIGIGYRGPAFLDDGLTIHPCNLHGGDALGAFQAREFVQRERPSAILILNDLWIIAEYRHTLEEFRGQISLIAYAPLDGRLHDAAPLANLNFLDCLVLYTDFAKEEVTDVMRNVNPDSNANSFPKIRTIPHGVDTRAFFPMTQTENGERCPRNRAAIRRRVFPALDNPGEAFIVLNANRPRPRKRVDLTMEGFARFARNKPPGVKLCLHHAIANREERETLIDTAARLEIEDRILWSADPDDPTPSDHQLNLLYNACDVGVNTSMGEGWGLISFEHAATGAAQIVPDHSACKELWRGKAAMLQPGRRVENGSTPLEQIEVASTELADCLEQLYRDPSYRLTMSTAAYENATQKRYNWQNIAHRWEQLFKDVIHVNAAYS